jgi:FMN-dependent oxidoreductase (nitrilotriacetate monooxygenase family)
MILSAFLSTNHPGSWRHPEGEPERHEFAFYKQLVEAAERGKLDLFFIADKLCVFDNETFISHSNFIRMDPISLLSALSVITTHIGLAGTISTTYNEPYHAARRLATLDHLSHGRAAWNVVTSTNDEEARNFGLDKHVEHAERYERAQEFVELAKGLWHCWEDDAFPVDREKGIFADSSKLRVLDHSGKHFKVRGPMNLAKSPQGTPVIVFAGSSPECQRIAAIHGDAVFCSPNSLEEAQQIYADFKARAVDAGRDPGTLKILPHTMITVCETEEEAWHEADKLMNLVPEPLIVQTLSRLLEYELAVHDLDSPPPAAVRAVAIQRLDEEWTEEHEPTLRELYQRWARKHATSWQIVGTPEQVADELAYRVERKAADGFNLSFPYLPGGLERFVQLVIPILQERGLFHREYTGQTLRESLGLDRVN